MNVQLTWGTYLEADNKLVGQVPIELSFLIFTFLKKSPQWEQKCKSRRLENGFVVPGSSQERPAEQSPQNLKQRSFVWRVYAPWHGHKTTVFVMWHYRLFVSNWKKMNLGWYVSVLLYNIRIGALSRMGAPINKNTSKTQSKGELIRKGALIGRRAQNWIITVITVLETILKGRQPRENIQRCV